MSREIGTPAAVVRDAPLSNLSFQNECALLAFLYEQEAIRLLRETSFVDAADRRSQAQLNFAEARHALITLSKIVRCSGGANDVSLRLDIDPDSAAALAQTVSGAALLDFRIAVAALMTASEVPEAIEPAGGAAKVGDLPLRAFVAAASPLWLPESVGRFAAAYSERRDDYGSGAEVAGFDAMMDLIVAVADRRFTCGKDFDLFSRMRYHAMTNAFEASRARNGLVHVANLVVVGCERILSGERYYGDH